MPPLTPLTHPIWPSEPLTHPVWPLGMLSCSQYARSEPPWISLKRLKKGLLLGELGERKVCWLSETRLAAPVSLSTAARSARANQLKMRSVSIWATDVQPRGVKVQSKDRPMHGKQDEVVARRHPNHPNCRKHTYSSDEEVNVPSRSCWLHERTHVQQYIVCEVLISISTIHVWFDDYNNM